MKRKKNKTCIYRWVTGDDASCAQKTYVMLNTLTKYTITTLLSLPVKPNVESHSVQEQCRAMPTFEKNSNPHLRGSKSGCICNIAEGRYCGK